MQVYLNRSMNFTDYRRMIDDLVADGRTTGLEQTESRVGFTKLNKQRMSRLEKVVTLDEAAAKAAREIPRHMIWLILTEAWCGDAAQNVPVIEKIAASSEKIETRYLLRDENLELMDRFLENGARSIPKLIVLDRETLEVLGTWGSRPKELRSYFLELKQEGLDKAEIGELLQRWYNRDRGRSLQREFEELIREWSSSKPAFAAA